MKISELLEAQDWIKTSDPEPKRPGRKAKTSLEPVGRGPTRQLDELAELMGITPEKLRSLKKEYPGFPDPLVTNQRSYGAHKKYYSIAAAKKWYQGVKAKLQSDIDDLQKQKDMK